MGAPQERSGDSRPAAVWGRATGGRETAEVPDRDLLGQRENFGTPTFREAVGGLDQEGHDQTGILKGSC